MSNKSENISSKSISYRLIRYDLEKCEEENGVGTTLLELTEKPRDRDELIREYNLPTDSIIKLNFEKKLIPWSLIPKCSNVEFQVFRPHQNIKPKMKERASYDSLIRQKVNQLEARIEFLEKAMDPATIDAKTEMDLELITQQISLLTKRMELADQAEWIKRTGA